MDGDIEQNPGPSEDPMEVEEGPRPEDLGSQPPSAVLARGTPPCPLCTWEKEGKQWADLIDHMNRHHVPQGTYRKKVG